MKIPAPVMIALLACSACSEHALVRSEPPGAQFCLDGRPIGSTPVEITVPRSEFTGPLAYRVEHAGYETREGTLSKRVAPGRIVGGYFSLGISFIFKRPTALRDRYDFVLTPEMPEPATGG